MFGLLSDRCGMMGALLLSDETQVQLLLGGT